VAADALEVLGSKAARGAEWPGTLDLEWLRGTDLSDRELSFMGKDPGTPWDAFRRFSTSPGSKEYAIWANTSTRGIAGELVAQRDVKEILPGYKISDRQVPVGAGAGTIDFEVTSNLGTKHGLEVKSFTRKRWADALDAYQARAKGVTLTAKQEKDVEAIDRMLDQLRNARAKWGTDPFLAISSDIAEGDKKVLQALLRDEAQLSASHLVSINEADIVEAGRSLRQGLGITK